MFTDLKTRNVFFTIILMASLAPLNVFSQRSNEKKVMRKLQRNWPVKTKHNYRQFYKIYTDDSLSEALLKGKDSSSVVALLGEGEVMSRELFDLTFNNMSGNADFGYAVLYKINYSHFKCRDDDWYLAQFAVIFDTSGRAYKILDHLARGYTLFDKRKRKEG